MLQLGFHGCSIVDCELMNISQVYEGNYFGPVSFKACQYAMNNENISMDLRQVNMKDAQIGLQKKFIWTKKSMMGRQ